MKVFKTIKWSISAMMICALLFSCSEIKKDKKGREDFSAFIDKFYSDVNFQFSRIEFPVPGSKTASGKIELIEREQWDTFRPLDKNNPDYDIKNIELADDLMEHRIVVKKSYVVKSYFSLNPVTNKWYLSSYPGTSTPNSKIQVPANEDQIENPVKVTPDTTYE